MERSTAWVPYLIPAMVVQLALMAIALVDLTRRERTRGPKWVWALVIVVIDFLGPITYLIFGREK